MTFEECIPYAKNLAEQTLENGFDIQAFQVLAQIKQLHYDVVPESSVDEGIGVLLKLFTDYSNDGSAESLMLMLTCLHQIISELYHTCETKAERLLFLDFIDKLQLLK